MAPFDEARPTFDSSLSPPAASAQFELGGGRPLVSVTDDCWRDLELPRYSSAEQSGRELRAMEWRLWNTHAVGEVC